MYSPVMQSPLKWAISWLRHAVTDLITPTVELVGPIVIGVVLVGVVVIGALILYKIFSIEGHRLERPDPLE